MAEVGEQELWAAYARARSDMQQQRSLPMAGPLMLFELDLQTNLEKLRALINNRDHPFDFPLGGALIAPRQKGAQDEPSSEATPKYDCDTIDPSDPETIERLVEPHPRRLFRPSVQLLILSSIWMARIGPHLEKLQGPDSYGNRLRKTLTPTDSGPSFQPYIGRYIQWRNRALQAAARAARDAHHVEVLTFDISNFYGSIDANFLLSDAFTHAAELDINAIDDLRLTARLAESFASLVAAKTVTGLPIGLPASAVIANAALFSVDKALKAEPRVLYYGRYVDDFIIVRRQSPVGAGNMSSATPQTPSQIAQELFDKARPGYLSETSKLTIAESKTRSIKISPKYSKAFLAELRRSFGHLASEWRQLPTKEGLKNLGDMVLATAAGKHLPLELRDADTLALRRWTLSTLLSKFSKFAGNLAENEWGREWGPIYWRLAPTVLGAANLPASLKYLRDFIALSLTANDDKISKDLGDKLRDAREKLQTYSEDLSEFGQYLNATIIDALTTAAGSLSPSKTRARALVRQQRLMQGRLDAKAPTEASDDLPDYIPLLLRALWSDQGIRPVWEQLVNALISTRKRAPQWVTSAPRLRTSSPNNDSTLVAEQLAAAFEDHDSSRFLGIADWLLLAARRPSASMLSIFHSDRNEEWPKFVEAVTGASARAPTFKGGRIRTPFRRLSESRMQQLTVAVGNIRTDDDWFTRAVQNKPLENAQRRESLHSAFNHALAAGRIDYLLTPELAIPRRFSWELARNSALRGTSTLLGLEYEVASRHSVRNSVLVTLAGPRNQYWMMWQDKTSPAHGERNALRQISDRALTPDKPESKKPIYNHRGVYFSVLVCSELLNAVHRSRLRGKIDLLFVPEWNRDLQAFDALTTATVSDIHCYLAQSNNRRFGDSLVRSPARDEWMKVAVRVRGGLADHFMAGTIDVVSLRKFQSLAVSPDEFFKPTPDGFVISKRRFMRGELGAKRPREK